jgi:hypothetical protein
MGLIGPDDPLILKVAETLRARIASQMQLSSPTGEVSGQQVSVAEIQQ